MKFNPEIHHRRSIRLKNYDYSQPGAYFVTICSWNRECILGDVSDGEMRLNEYGKIVGKEWLQTNVIRSNIELDAYIVMPNHIHGIIVLKDVVGATRWVAQNKNMNIQNMAIHQIAHTEKPIGLAPNSLGAIIGQFKSIVTKQINLIRNTPAVSIWHRNYYEHIVRNENELIKIREYILNNPLKWELDNENPQNIQIQRRNL